MLQTFMFFLAQLETGGQEAAGNAAEQSGQAPGGAGLGFFLPMMAALLVVMLLMRPKKGNSQQAARIAELKKNDRVVTAGGIIGTVLTNRDDTNFVTLRIDESTNTKMQIVKSSIIKVLDDEKDDDKK